MWPWRLEAVLPQLDGRIPSPFGARAGQIVKLHFDGFFIGGRSSGKKFDTSRGKLDDWGREDFYRFLLGEDGEAIRDGWCIRGFTVAVESMNRGEISEFIFEPDYAYGERGCTTRPKVHKNAICRYVIQFFAWRPRFTDKLNLDAMSMEERLQKAIVTKNEATSYYRDDQYCACPPVPGGSQSLSPRPDPDRRPIAPQGRRTSGTATRPS